MKVYRYLTAVGCLFALPVLVTGIIVGEDTNKIKNDFCSAANPASTCAATNTCGSASSSCIIDIRRSQGTYATATPSIPGAKSNKPFCIKVATAVTFSTRSKNTGFVIDFDKANPFDHQGAIIGGADRPVTVTAKHPGCYSYAVGACIPGTVYGVWGNAETSVPIVFITAHGSERSSNCTLYSRELFPETSNCAGSKPPWLNLPRPPDDKTNEFGNVTT